MAVQEKITRQYAGHGESGDALYYITRHGVPRAPESVGEWAAERAAYLGTAALASPAGRILAALLASDSPEALEAAVAAGQDLSEQGRWGVYKTLEKFRDLANGSYPKALSFTTALRDAWAGVWGDKEPKAPRDRHLRGRG
jgi:hypothetical protein